MISTIAAAAAVLALATFNVPALAQVTDSRLREVEYDPRAVVTVPVKRGIVTLVVLDRDEAISDIASGLGGDCAKAEAVWCVSAQAGGHDIFIKPKSGASAANNLAVVTDRRTHAFRFVVLPDGDAREPVYRLVVKAPVARAVAIAAPIPDPVAEVVPIPEPSPRELVAERLKTAPTVVNTEYSIAVGKASDDIVPKLVFDDGRFTYFGFPGQREVPAVFHVQGDGSEALVNTRMEGELLVVDRVSRRLILRTGTAVVGVWNEAFDIDGAPLHRETTVSGVERSIRSDESSRPFPQLRPGAPQ